jgi:hypothetical protein
LCGTKQWGVGRKDTEKSANGIRFATKKWWSVCRHLSRQSIKNKLTATTIPPHGHDWPASSGNARAWSAAMS